VTVLEEVPVIRSRARCAAAMAAWKERRSRLVAVAPARAAALSKQLAAASAALGRGAIIKKPAAAAAAGGGGDGAEDGAVIGGVVEVSEKATEAAGGGGGGGEGTRAMTKGMVGVSERAAAAAAGEGANTVLNASNGRKKQIEEKENEVAAAAVGFVRPGAPGGGRGAPKGSADCGRPSPSAAIGYAGAGDGRREHSYR
jgi:hypothetical protein